MPFIDTHYPHRTTTPNLPLSLPWSSEEWWWWWLLWWSSWGWFLPFLVSWVFIIFVFRESVDTSLEEEDESSHHFICHCRLRRWHWYHCQHHQILVFHSWSCRTLRYRSLWRQIQWSRPSRRIILLHLTISSLPHYLGTWVWKISCKRRRFRKQHIILLALILLFLHCLHHDHQRCAGDDDDD